MTIVRNDPYHEPVEVLVDHEIDMVRFDLEARTFYLVVGLVGVEISEEELRRLVQELLENS
jgi:hypothetical protein